MIELAYSPISNGEEIKRYIKLEVINYIGLKGVHKSLKIRAQYNGKTQLVLPLFMDPEITAWVSRLRPLETQEIDFKNLNPTNLLTRRLRQKVEKLEKELESKMDQNSITVSKVFSPTWAQTCA